LPSRGSLGALDGYHPYNPGDAGDAGPERPSGRAHLRPVPSGSNGVAHRGWLRRGSAVDLGRFADTDQDRAGGPAEDDPVDAGPSRHPEGQVERPGDRTDERQLHDELRGPEVDAPGLGDEHAPDAGPRGHTNGSRGGGGILNGAAYDLLGGSPDAAPQDSERSPWSDGRGRDAGRPERIEGWFATRDDMGTEAGLSAVAPSDRRRRRHRLRDDDVLSDSDSAETHDGGAGDLGEGGDGGASGDFGASPGTDTGSDAGPFGTGSVEETRIGGMHPVAPPADGEALDGSGDGTPRLGVPAQEAPSEQERAHPLADADGGADQDAPRTTALRSERIMGAAPGEPERPVLEDGPVTGGLVLDGRQDEQVRPQRPPLGLLVFDDGTTYTVDAEYLMGRMPEADPRVASGALRSLALEDTSGAVSRVHAQIVVNGWDALLVDVGSRNGTFVSPPGEQGWTQLPAGETHRLVPGTRVRIGGRSFQFEAPSGAH
jgi:hypothetical protein